MLCESHIQQKRLWNIPYIAYKKNVLLYVLYIKQYAFNVYNSVQVYAYIYAQCIKQLKALIA